jgi:enoyl-CoA hydratase/carnithine racemase
MISHQYKYIILEEKEDIAILFLNNPEKLNAFNLEVSSEIHNAILNIEKSEKVKAVIITGNGDGFCSGADLNYLFEIRSKNDSDTFRELLEYGKQMMGRIIVSEKVFISAINGPAIGGGLSLALSCDVRICSEKAKFGVPFLKIGFYPNWGLTYFIPQIVGTGKALELFLDGVMIGAQEAEKIGFIKKVVSSENLLKEAKLIAEKFIGAPQGLAGMIKKGVRQSIVQNFDEILKYEVEAQMKCFESPDSLEGVKAFVEKRKPVFFKECV